MCVGELGVDAKSETKSSFRDITAVDETLHGSWIKLW